VIVQRSPIARYLQLADDLRARIAAGEFAPGDLLPSEPRLVQDYEIGRITVRQAVAVLRAERLVEHERGVGIRVREPQEQVVIEFSPGDGFEIRLATPEELEEFDLDVGGLVMEIKDASGGARVVPAYPVKGTFLAP
jgi:GntR family transcriptional regulator